MVCCSGFKSTYNASSAPINHDIGCSDTSIVCDDFNKITGEQSPCRYPSDDGDGDIRQGDDDLMTSSNTSSDSLVECLPPEVLSASEWTIDDAMRRAEKSKALKRCRHLASSPTVDTEDCENDTERGGNDKLKMISSDDFRAETTESDKLQANPNVSCVKVTQRHRSDIIDLRKTAQKIDNSETAATTAISNSARRPAVEENHVTRLQSFVESLRRVRNNDELPRPLSTADGVQSAKITTRIVGCTDGQNTHPIRSSNTSSRVHRLAHTPLRSSSPIHHPNSVTSTRHPVMTITSRAEADMLVRQVCLVNGALDTDNKPLDLSLKAGRKGSRTKDCRNSIEKSCVTAARETDAKVHRIRAETAEVSATGVTEMTSSALVDLVKQFDVAPASGNTKVGSSAMRRVRASSTFTVGGISPPVPPAACTSSRLPVAVDSCGAQSSPSLPWNSRLSPWYLPMSSTVGRLDWLSRGCLRRDSLDGATSLKKEHRARVAEWTKLSGFTRAGSSSAGKPSIVDDNVGRRMAPTTDRKRIDKINLCNKFSTAKKRPLKRHWIDPTVKQSVGRFESDLHTKSEKERRVTENDVTTCHESKTVDRRNATQQQRSSTTALTGFRCVVCEEQCDTLYNLTVHLETTGHSPVAETSAAFSPSVVTNGHRPRCKRQQLTEQRTSEQSKDDNGLRRRLSPHSFPILPQRSMRPQRLVRGQDVWLSRGDEQTGRILRCVRCDAAARSLAELTMHMVRTGHYAGIVGPVLSRPQTETVQRRKSDTGKMNGAQRL